MIKIKLTSLGTSQDTTQQIVDLETVTQATDRILKASVRGGDVSDHFQVLIDGRVINKKFWVTTILRTNNFVLVAPIIGTDASTVFRSIATIGIAIAAAYVAGPAGLALTGAYAGAFVAGATIAGGLLLNALIPPSIPGLGIAPQQAISDSQMFTITSQSNALNKFGHVPKVYGSHRIFPTIAANPYTELIADGSGTLVQYFIAIYDFGLGPVALSDIKIGDTPIEQFSDKVYNIVDLNRPFTDEGSWDAGVLSTFSLYKGDNTTDNLGIVFTENRDQGGQVEANYTATRNTTANPNGAPQTITLTFVNAQGLIAYDSTGKAYDRTINLSIEFAIVGTDDWHLYNDTNFVHSYDSQGGLVNNTKIFAFGSIQDSNTSDVLVGYVSTAYDLIEEGVETTIQSNPVDSIFQRTDWFGLKAGTTQFLIHQDGSVSINQALYSNSVFLGYITAIDSVPLQPTYVKRVTVDRPISKNIYLFYAIRHREVAFFAGQIITYVSAGRANDSVFQIANISTGTARIVGQDTIPVYSTFSFSPRATTQFKVRVTRTTSSSTWAVQVVDALTWAQISTRLQTAAIVTDKRHTFMELKILATSQLNGSISNLSAVATSALDTFDGTNWVRALTANPAWIVADLLTGQVNKRAIAKTRLDTDSLLEWAEYCDEIPEGNDDHQFTQPRFEADFVLDYDATLSQVINQVAGMAQASLNVVNGKYGVLLDIERDTPVQVFTQRNYKNFSSSRNYTRQPDALNVAYVDPSLDWDTTSVPVYDNGFDATNVTQVDDLTAFGATNAEQAWRYGRYMMAQNRLRQETITIDVDFEYLACTRGDFVQLTQDSMLAGGAPARVISITGGNIIRIDDGLEIDPMLSYGYILRSQTGGIVQGTIDDVIDDQTFEFSGPVFPEEGDLVVIGEITTLAIDCIVKAIRPSNDLTATLTLVERATEIYTIDQVDTLPIYDPKLSKTVNSDVSAPPAVQDLTVADNAYECLGSGYQYFIQLTWDVPAGVAFDLFEVFADDGRGYDLIGTTKSQTYKYIVDQTRLGIEHSFKVVAVSATGKRLDLGSVPAVTATPIKKTTAPTSLDHLNTDITGEVIQLLWDPIKDCDVGEYLIRYSPLVNGASWESSIPLLRVDNKTTLTSTQARTGTYLIKAIDFNLNESLTAAQAITTIPNLFNLNIIEETTDFPDLVGAKDRTVAVGGALLLDHVVAGGVETAQYYSEGYYYYADLLDLGEIYTVRLQSLIQAEGNTAEDIMSNWITLDSVIFMANSRFSEWDVESQYRTTNKLNVMADWTSLDVIDPISEGDQDNFTPWRKFIQGDATGRIFEFRLKLVSNKTSVSPRVIDGTIRADMPDRLDSDENLFATGGTCDVVYVPAFKGPSPSPNVQISIDGAESGDYWTYSAKTLEGFTVNFFDVNGDPAERQFDWQAKGFGFKADDII